MIQETHCLIFVSGSMIATAIIAFAAGLLFSGAKFDSFREAIVHSYGYSAAKKDDDLFETYSSNESSVDGDDADQRDEQYKLMLCVRNDLKMSKGKMCAQCGHATLGLYRKFATSRFTDKWLQSGQAKIAVKINGEEMLQLYKAAKANGIPAFVVHDAGRTQVAAGSATVLAIGPASASRLQPITGHLPLL